MIRLLHVTLFLVIGQIPVSVVKSDIELESSTAFENESFSMSCQFTDVGIYIFWQNYTFFNATTALYAYAPPGGGGGNEPFNDWLVPVVRANGSYENGTKTHTVTVDPVQLSDDRTFYCDNGLNGAGRELYNDTLTVQVAPTNATLLLPPEIYEGYEVVVTCSTSRVKPVEAITFFIITNNNNFTAVLTSNSTNPDGTQSAVARADVGFNRNDQNKTVYCEVFINGTRPFQSDRQTVNVLFAPVEATPTNANVDVDLNSNAQLECNVTTGNEGNPHEYNYTWTRANDATTETNDGRLTFNVTNVCQDDVYYCTPNNKAGSGGRGEITLTVQNVPAAVVQDLVDSSVDVPNFVEETGIVCAVEGRGDDITATFTGFNTSIFAVSPAEAGTGNTCNGRVEMMRQTVQLLWNTDDLELRKQGSGNVTCQAKTESQITDVKDIDVNVQYMPYWTVSVGFAYAEFNQTQVTIPCNDTANPESFSYLWFKNDFEEIVNNNSVLTLAVVEDDDFTNYTCIATNILGSSSHVIALELRGPPLLQSLNTVDNITSAALTLEWELVTTGGYNMQGYTIYCRPRNTSSEYVVCADYIDTSPEGVKSQTVTGLNASTSYDFTVQGKNEREDRNDANDTTNGITRGTPDVQITYSNFKLTSTSLTVFWFYDPDPLYRVNNQTEEYNIEMEIVTCDPDHVCRFPEYFPVELMMAVVDDDFKPNTKYVVEFKVLENGFKSQFFEEHYVSFDEDLSSGAVAGIVIAILLIVSIVILLGLIQTERVKIPTTFRNDSPSDNDSARRMDALQSEGESNGGYGSLADLTGTSGGAGTAQPQKRKQHETFDKNPTPGTDRELTQDGLIYIKLDFPNYRPPKKGPARIIGEENKTEYATIDFNKVVQLPPEPEYCTDEEELFDSLPPKRNVGYDEF